MDERRCFPGEAPYPSAEPPAVLYHAVSADRLEAALSQGLVPGGRPHVHLSRRPEHARKAIREEHHPVILRVDAAGMHAAGCRFFASPKGTWLTGTVPAGFIRRAED